MSEHHPIDAIDRSGHPWRSLNLACGLDAVDQLHDDPLPDQPFDRDAAYVALAEALRAPPVTADARLAQAPGPDCEIDVLGG